MLVRVEKSFKNTDLCGKLPNLGVAVLGYQRSLIHFSDPVWKILRLGAPWNRFLPENEFRSRKLNENGCIMQLLAATPTDRSFLIRVT
jgi:hypothetical protein